MIAKIWKKLLLAVCIIAILFNITAKLVNRTSLEKAISSSPEGVDIKKIFNVTEPQKAKPKIDSSVSQYKTVDEAKAEMKEAEEEKNKEEVMQENKQQEAQIEENVSEESIEVETEQNVENNENAEYNSGVQMFEEVTGVLKNAKESVQSF